MSNFRRLETELKASSSAEGNGSDAAPRWLDEMRRAGIARFDAVGFPSTKDEAWRFTHVAPIARTAFELAPRRELAGVPPFSFGLEAAAELVFLNGHYLPQLSSTAGLPRTARVASLAEAVRSDGVLVESHLGRHAEIEQNPFVALNAGFVREGAFVHLRRGSTVPGPIHLLFLSSPGAAPAVSHPRVLVVAEDGVEATVVETYAGTGGGGGGAYFTNAVTEIVVGENAVLDHYKVQQELPQAYHVATMQVTVGRAGRFISHSATLGGKLTRNDLNVQMAGDGADATLNGLVIVGGEQHCDNHTLLDHAAPNCPSHELYKHVLSGKATAVFKGKILVRQPAQKTDSKQTSKSLLLSDDAYMNSQPALEIYADDVKCTHGSTTGPVDEDMVFYLRTRGVGLEAARHVLSYAFAADVTRRIKVDPVRRRLEDFMAARHGLPQDLRITDLGAHDDAAR